MAGSHGVNGSQPPDVEVVIVDVDGSPVRGVGSTSARSTVHSPSGAGRRLGIVLLLVLAIVGVVAVNHVQGNRVAGRATADWPQPPPVGSCLNIDDTRTSVVDCSGLHDAEVTRAFGPLDPMATARSQDPMYNACATAADQYIGLDTRVQPDLIPPATEGPVVWKPLPPGYAGSPIYAPADQRAGRYGWAACVIKPRAPGKYTGSIRGILSTNAADLPPGADGAAPIVTPATFRTCLDRQQQPASCVGPHHVEVLAAAQVVTSIRISNTQNPGTSAGSASSTAAAAEQFAELNASWQQQCTKFAASAIGTTDPTFDGKLLIRLGSAAGTTATVSSRQQIV